MWTLVSEVRVHAGVSSWMDRMDGDSGGAGASSDAAPPRWGSPGGVFDGSGGRNAAPTPLRVLVASEQNQMKLTSRTHLVTL